MGFWILGAVYIYMKNIKWKIVKLDFRERIYFFVLFIRKILILFHLTQAENYRTSPRLSVLLNFSGKKEGKYRTKTQSFTPTHVRALIVRQFV